MNENTSNTQVSGKSEFFYPQETATNKEYGYKIVGQKGSQNIIWAKHAMDKFVGAFKELKNNFIKLQKKNYELQKELEIKNKRLAEMERQHKVLAAQHEVLKAEYQKFARNKGQGRPKKLTDDIKAFIQTGVKHGVTVAGIHQRLEEKGIEISYEAVRKYVTHGKSTGDWS